MADGEGSDYKKGVDSKPCPDDGEDSDFSTNPTFWSVKKVGIRTSIKNSSDNIAVAYLDISLSDEWEVPALIRPNLSLPDGVEQTEAETNIGDNLLKLSPADESTTLVWEIQAPEVDEFDVSCDIDIWPQDMKKYMKPIHGLRSTVQFSGLESEAEESELSSETELFIENPSDNDFHPDTMSEPDDDTTVEELIEDEKSNNGNPGIATKTLNLLISLGSGPIWHSKLFIAPVPWTYDDSKKINEEGWTKPNTTLSYLMRDLLIRSIATLLITAVAAITFFRIPNTIASHPIAGFPPESTIIVGVAVISFGFLHGVSSIVSFMWSGTHRSEKEALIAASVLVSVPILIVFPVVWVLWTLTSVPLHGFVYIIGHFFQIGSRERKIYTYVHENLIE